MKNIIKILTILILLSLPMKFSYAQETESTDIPIQEEVETTNEETETSDELTSTTEKIQSSHYSFGTILLALLIPSIFLIICYLIFKSFKF